MNNEEIDYQNEQINHQNNAYEQCNDQNYKDNSNDDTLDAIVY